MRLIDADALKENSFEVNTKEYGVIDVVGVDCIDEADTVEPMPHGEWIYATEIDGWKRYECSNCSNVHIADTFTGDKLPPHCPYCGSLNVHNSNGKR